MKKGSKKYQTGGKYQLPGAASNLNQLIDWTVLSNNLFDPTKQAPQQAPAEIPKNYNWDMFGNMPQRPTVEDPTATMRIDQNQPKLAPVVAGGHINLADLEEKHKYGILDPHRTELHQGVRAFNTLAEIATGIGATVNNVKANQKEDAQYLKAIQPVGYENMERYGLNGLPVFTKFGGQVSKYQTGGQPEDPEVAHWLDLKKKYAGEYPTLKNGQGALDKRMEWVQWAKQALPTSGTPTELAAKAAKTTGFNNPGLILSSAMEEGVGARLKDSGYSDAYANANTKGELNGYGVDGFRAYGLDQIGSRVDEFIQKGYLPQDFKSKMKPYQASNEIDERDYYTQAAKIAQQHKLVDKNFKFDANPDVYNKLDDALKGYKGQLPEMKKSAHTAAFVDDESAFAAKAAFMRAEQDNVNNYVKKKGYTLTPEEQDFFTLASYNGGAGNGQKMLDYYGQKKLLGNNGFLKEKMADKGQIYDNVLPRLAGGNLFNKEGYFNTDATAQQAAPIIPIQKDTTSQTTGMKAFQTGGSANKPTVDKATYDQAKQEYFQLLTKTAKQQANQYERNLLHESHRIMLDNMQHYEPGGKWTTLPLKDAAYQIGNTAREMFNGILGTHYQTGGQASNLIEAEQGEAFQGNDGSINQISDNAATHEQGGVIVPDVHRVLENTSKLRNDKDSKYLKLSPEKVKALTGLDTTKDMSHAEALKKADEVYEKDRQKIVSKINLASKDRKDLDKYAEKSIKLNMNTFQSIPNKQQLFDNLFNHQELVKAMVGIETGQAAQFGGKYAEGGVVRPPRGAKQGDYVFDEGTQRWFKKGETPTAPVYTDAAGKTSAPPTDNPGDGITAYKGDKVFKGNASKYSDDEWRQFAKRLGFTGKTNVELQKFLFDNAKTKPIIQGLHKQFGDPNGGTWFDGKLGHRWDAIIDNFHDWTDNTPDAPKAPAAPQNLDTSINANVQHTTKNESKFFEPLRWFDVASPANAYLSSLERLPEKYNPTDLNQIRSKLQDPTAALQQNQADFNAASQSVANTSAGVGAVAANIANLAASKYAANNQLLGGTENQNAQIKNSEIMYNAQARDKQGIADQQAREAFEEKVLTGKAKQQEQKLTALDSLYKTIAENRALNRNGNLIMKFSKAFDQYANYNGYQHLFAPNPAAGIIAANNSAYTIATQAKGKTDPAGTLQGLKMGQDYYNKKTGKTYTYNGQLIEK